MAGRLVGARVQAHVQHHGALILGRVDVDSAEGEREVVVVERRLELLVDVDTVSLELQGVDRLGDHRVEHAAIGDLRLGELVVVRSRVEGHGVVNHEVALGRGDAVDNLVGQQREVVPVAVLVGIRRTDVVGRAEAEVDRLDGPLQVREQHVVVGHLLAIRLEAVDADEREPDAADVDVVNLRIDEDVVDVQLRILDLLGGVDGRVVGEHRGLGHPLDGVVDGQGGSSAGAGAARGLLLHSEAEEQIARGDEQDVVLILNVNLNEALTVGDRHGGDRQARIGVEPEDARVSSEASLPRKRRFGDRLRTPLSSPPFGWRGKLREADPLTVAPIIMGSLCTLTQ